MILELIATGLLAYGVASNSVNRVYGNSNDSNDNHIVEKLDLPRNNAFSNSVFGAYNWRDEFDWQDIYDSMPVNQIFTYEFDASTSNYYVPIWCNVFNQANSSYSYAYLQKIELSYRDDNTYDDDAVFTLYFYDYDGDTYNYTFTLWSGVPSTQQELIINFRQSYTFNDIYHHVFDIFFTSDDNTWVTSYNGYYNFANTTTLFNAPFGVYGSIAFNNTITFGMSNTFVTQSNSGYANHNVWFDSYDNTTLSYGVTRYYYPFDRNSVVSSNLLFNNVKMSKTSYNYLGLVGIFSYQRDSSYDDTDFHDLLFGVMDSSLFMLSRLLNFDLFGMNLFVAFSGLLTLAVVIVVIRKIW